MDFIPDLETLAKIFSNAIAPAFFLGAVAGFVNLMTSRLAAVGERIRAARANTGQKSAVGRDPSDLTLLNRRARLLLDGIILALCSAVCSTLLLAIMFAMQFFGIHRAYGAPILFVVATLLLGLALYRFVQEAWYARREFDL